MNGATLDLTTSIVNLRRLADRIERGESIVPVRVVSPAPSPVPAIPPMPAPVTLPSLPPPPPMVAAAEILDIAADTDTATQAPIIDAPQPLEPQFALADHTPDAAPADEKTVREESLAQLEQVRAELSDLGGRRLSPWTRRRLEDAQAAEREILGRLGFDSYLDVMLALAAGSPQSEPGLAPSSKLPSLASFAALPSLPSTAPSVSVAESADHGAGDAGAAMDNGGSEDGSLTAPESVHEIGERFDEAPAEPEVVAEPEPAAEPEVVAEPAGPSTIADWLRTSSFAGARNELVDVNVGA